jgi:hypothetical protein
MKVKAMNLEELRQDIMSQQKKGLPYIIGSVVIWILIAIPFIALALGLMFNSLILSCSMIAIEIVFVIMLFQELK